MHIAYYKQISKLNQKKQLNLQLSQCKTAQTHNMQIDIKQETSEDDLQGDKPYIKAFPRAHNVHSLEDDHLQVSLHKLPKYQRP